MISVEDTTCIRYSAGTWSTEPTGVAREVPLTVFLNGTELVTILCTPVKVNHLVFGFLYSEGIIDSARDVAMMRVCDDEMEVDVRLISNNYVPPKARTVTSGCGGGSMLGGRDADKLRVKSELQVLPQQINVLMKHLLESSETHRQHGGLHTSAMGDGQSLTVVAEDIGRHNTLDKIVGECLLKGMPMTDRLLFSTGRMSSEMMLKVARMGVPVAVSRGAITDRAIAFARDLGITAVGYARGERFTVYSHPERLGLT
jgi:FdhD protein